MRTFDEGSKASTPAMRKILQSIRHPVRYVLEYSYNHNYAPLDRALRNVHENARLVSVYAPSPVSERSLIRTLADLSKLVHREDDADDVSMQSVSPVTMF